MKSNTRKQSALRRFKSRVLRSSCIAPSVVGQMQDEDKIESKVNESRAISRKKKTLFGSIPDKFGFRFRRLLNLGTGSKNLHSSNAPVSLQNEVSEEMVTIENNSQQNNRSIVSNWEEPLENSARFGRTLSVGRLRDRVLRRTLSNNVGGSLIRELWPDYLSSGLYNGRLENESGIMEFRGGNGVELLEQRSVFLERGRGIRSQVRALQRLGSRFENLSGHERSCILSGRHRTGRCSCRESNHVVSANEDNTSTRSSISRIVLLAESLFEVLDEFHQRSVALTSPSSYSPLGSIPAPKEVVNTMPMKVYCRPQKHQNEEAAQCYICLLEYEDGDQLRILPCNHEFHQTCVDKWLKEIHRVCPLCRGDVCRSDVFGAR